MVLATLDLLRRSGLTGAGINRVVADSGAPKGSLYHYFPGGKQELTTAALHEAGDRVGQWLADVLGRPAPLADRIAALFAEAAARLQAGRFTRGCPVAAVTLDLDRQDAGLRAVCREVFDGWQETIAAGLDGVPEDERLPVARLILATFEGALVLARAAASPDPLLGAGRSLAGLLDGRGPVAAPPAGRGRRRG